MGQGRWLSRNTYERLRGELEQLRTEGRQRMAARIERAREQGDLSENAEYEAAKEDQGKLEARIRELEGLLREARVGQPPQEDRVGPGLVVSLLVDGEEETYFVSDTREDRHPRHEVLSTASPIGRAVLGAKPGDTVTAQVPAGTLTVTVASVRRG